MRCQITNRYFYDILKYVTIIIGAVTASAPKHLAATVVGKAIRKMTAIPSILYGRAVITMSKTNVEKVQRIENKVWKYLLGIGGYSTVEALRGEIGASMVKSRIMETMLTYMLDTLSSNFTNVKDMMKDTITKGKGRWYNTIDKYRMELGISWENMLKLDSKNLKKLVREYDNAKWKEGLSNKSCMRIYNMEKTNIGYEKCYRNTYSSKLYARARINALQLEEHKGRGQEYYDTTCKLCGEENEDLNHFITNCKELETKRNYNLINKNIREQEERMKDVLFRNRNHTEVSKMIMNMWNLRKKF